MYFEVTVPSVNQIIVLPASNCTGTQLSSEHGCLHSVTACPLNLLSEIMNHDRPITAIQGAQCIASAIFFYEVLRFKFHFTKISQETVIISLISAHHMCSPLLILLLWAFSHCCVYPILTPYHFVLIFIKWLSPDADQFSFHCIVCDSLYLLYCGVIQCLYGTSSSHFLFQ